MSASLDNDVGRGGQHRQRGDHRERGEEEKAHPVQHHGCKLPVCLHRARLVLLLDLVGDDPDLLEDEAELSLKRAGRGRVVCLVTVGKVGVRPARDSIKRVFSEYLSKV